jgi:hypothetical protein
VHTNHVKLGHGGRAHRFRRSRLAIVVGLVLSLFLSFGIPAQALTYTGNAPLFGCSQGQVVVDIPDDSFINQGLTWWIAEVFQYDGQQWNSYTVGDWHYAYGLGAYGPWGVGVREMVNVRTNVSESAHFINVAPGYYYAVNHWLWVDGEWVGPYGGYLTGNSGSWWCLA